jgi:hypothetical protein
VTVTSWGDLRDAATVGDHSTVEDACTEFMNANYDRADWQADYSEVFGDGALTLSWTGPRGESGWFEELVVTFKWFNDDPDDPREPFLSGVGMGSLETYVDGEPADFHDLECYPDDDLHAETKRYFTSETGLTENPDSYEQSSLGDYEHDDGADLTPGERAVREALRDDDADDDDDDANGGGRR